MNLKRHLNRLLALLMCCALLCCPVSADVQDCALRVTLLDDAKQPVQGINIEICRVTDYDGTAHTLTPEFAQLPLLPHELAASLTPEQTDQIYQYVLSNGLQGAVQTTNDKGIVDFTLLQQGVYLVFERGGQAISFQPYPVVLPTVSGGSVYHSVNSQPKVVSADSRTITVYIEWIDRDNAAGKRPESVDVELTHDVIALMAEGAAGTSIRRATLNPQSQWQHTFRMLPNYGVYGVKESAVPEYEYLGCTEVPDGFVLAYRYQRGTPPGPGGGGGGGGGGGKPDPTPEEKLPQTGFRLLPVYLMLAGGAALVILGMADLCVSKEEP